MPNIEIYTKDYCPYSWRAKALLESKGAPYEEIDVTHDPEREREMIARSGRRTVPEIFFDGRLIGGSDELHALEASGELDRLLERSGGVRRAA